MKKWLLLLFLYTTSNAQPSVPDVPKTVWDLSEILFHDVVNPPAAARFYAYALLAGLEADAQLNHNTQSFHYQFNGYTRPILTTEKNADARLTTLYAILETGKLLIPSGYLLEEKQNALKNSFSNLGDAAIVASVGLAERVARHVVAYSKTDGYFRLSNLPRYKPLKGMEYWQPTPPEYMPAVEPHWKTIRTFFLDSAQQCRPTDFVPFNPDSSSSFASLCRDVYEATTNLTPEQTSIANFWDCNPFAVQFSGHMSIGLKKLSPGGHWLGITGIVSRQQGLDLSQCIRLHALIACAMHDAFISCWEAKYNLNRVRPETVIRKYIDEKWQPLLQTPPFPEFPSGHSVVSTAVSEILTELLGNVSYTDSVETYIGLPPRNFSSFRQAAAEARISRLYGGIHFRDAIEEGNRQGEALARLILKKSGVVNLLRKGQQNKD